MAQEPTYPDAADSARVGEYPAVAAAGGGLVWDEVLEYRVWCQTGNGAEDLMDGDDYFYSFATHEEALAFSLATIGAEEVLALIRQVEYLDEPEPGQYRHVKEERIAEWPARFLSRPKRTLETIPAFLAPDAPPNRLDILRGMVG